MKTDLFPLMMRLIVNPFDPENVMQNEPDISACQ